ncbi:MAG: HEPN domain-containing protein [Chloroflexi bacterium]|nr:HEPN domain-containing protein [Chloroflexota bacterium]MBI3742330.1 HEPN domain-containing protein [Chloroflexota bacterium]
MPPRESSNPSDWLRVAEKDLDRVSRMLDDDDSEAAGFYLQQSLEKFLKAFLLSKGWRLERIHDLEALLDAALKYDTSLETFRDACQKITGFYIVERYPFIVASGLTKSDVQTSLDQIKGLVEKIRSQVRQT